MSPQNLMPEPLNGSVRDIHKFSYVPLNSERHIRFLRITQCDELQARNSLPSANGQGPSPHFLSYYEIVQVDMSDLPKYYAVSYAWGEPERTHFIRISGMHHLQITNSLAVALQRLVRNGLTGLLWIDQICIDQSNLQERNHQVMIMGEIYSNAEEVIIWTGEEIEYLCEVRDLIPLPDAFSDNGLEALCQLLCRPWFKRAWVVQEAVLAKAATVVAGSCQISLRDLFQALTKRGTYWTKEQISQIYDSDIFLSTMMALKKDTETPLDWEPGFDALLNHLGNCEASDLRDHVYAFLGFQQDFGISITPDYTLSASQVFTATARAIIEGTNSLNVFRFLPKDSNDRMKDLRLPSWVPDWSKRNYESRIHQDPFNCPDLHFTAANATRHHIRRASQSQQHELLVSGQIIDYATCILPNLCESIMRNHRMKTAQRPRFFSLSNEEVRDLDKTAYIDQTESLRKRLVTVLMAGQVRVEGEACSSPLHSDLETVEQILSLYDDDTKRLDQLDQVFYRLRRLEHYIPFHTKGGKLGLAPSSTSKGDLIAILHGFDVPIMLRRLLDGTYNVVGQCYLEDAMYGEAVIWEEHEANTFTLV